MGIKFNIVTNALTSQNAQRPTQNAICIIAFSLIIAMAIMAARLSRAVVRGKIIGQ